MGKFGNFYAKFLTKNSKVAIDNLGKSMSINNFVRKISSTVIVNSPN